MSNRIVQRSLAFVAIAFGLLTLVAGGRVLAGHDPGYVVYRPLLFFNTAMGVAYVVAGFLMIRKPRQGKLAAAAIFLLNVFVFAFIGYLYANSDVVAIDSIRAMTLRTGVWLALFLGMARLMVRQHSISRKSTR